MAVGVLGQKEGMTRVFTAAGESIPVTVIKVRDNKIVQLKSLDTDGYSAIQVNMGTQKLQRINKPLAGHYVKAGVTPGIQLKEFRLDNDDHSFELGQEISIEMFTEGSKVDVTGTSIGKGFAGAIKRHNFNSQRNSHGNSVSHRAPGSIGQNQTPGRVFKGKKMAGHMGNEQITVQNLLVVKIDTENGCLLVKGAVPGCKGGFLVVKPAVKQKRSSAK